MKKNLKKTAKIDWKAQAQKLMAEKAAASSMPTPAAPAASQTEDPKPALNFLQKREVILQVLIQLKLPLPEAIGIIQSVVAELEIQNRIDVEKGMRLRGVL